MNGKKGLFTLIFTGCLMIFTGFYLSWSLAAKVEDLGGSASIGKLSVSVKNQLDNSNENGFNISEINKIAGSLGSAAIGYSSQTYLMVGFENQTARSRVIGTNSQYRVFCNMDIKRGSFFSDTDDSEKNPVAVIDKELAWYLFKNDQVIGCSIYIAGRKFKIIGVTNHDGSVIGKLMEDGSMNVYVPMGTLLELKSEIRIDHFVVDNGTDGITGRNMELVSNALLALGKNPDNYIMIDYDIQNSVNNQKSKLVIFLIGIMMIIVILRYIVNHIKELVKSIRNDCKTDYLSSVLKLYRRNAQITLFMMLLAAAGIILIWQLIKFKVYISPLLIPDDLTDFSYFSRLLQDLVSQNVSNHGYMATYDEMMRNTAEALLNWSFYPGVLLGLLFFYSGVAGMRKSDIPLTTAVLACGIFLMACMALAILFTMMMGLGLVMDMKALSILWAFILTNLLIFTKMDERVEA